MYEMLPIKACGRKLPKEESALKYATWWKETSINFYSVEKKEDYASERVDHNNDGDVNKSTKLDEEGRSTTRR